MEELNSKQRKILEKYANNLNPVVIIGGNGVTESVTEKVLQSVNRHESLTIKFNEFKEEKHELTAELCKSCDAALVRIIGNVAVLYKPAEKPADRKYEKELKKLDFKKN